MDLQDNDGTTPLMCASFLGYKDIVHLLILKEANTAVKNNNGDTARDLAESNGHTEFVEFLD